MSNSLLDWVNVAIVALFPLLEVLGAVLCLVFRRLSNWLMVALVGFLGEAGISFVRLVLPLVLSETEMFPRHSTYMIVLILENLIAVGFFVLIVGGLGLAFADAQKKMRRLREDADHANQGRPFIPETRADWHPPAEGSQDIQR